MNDQRASDTAILIARSMLLAEATPSLSTLVSAENAALTRRLLVAVGPQRWFHFLLRYGVTRSLFFLVERLSLPGAFLHYVVRKKRIAALAAESFQQNIRQLVVLGAGLDTFAWQQARHSSVACFELDHPATQAVKKRAFHDEPLPTPTLIPADLAHDSIAGKLCAEPAFEPAQPAVFIAEGLLMYFPPTRVSQLIDELFALAAPGSRFIFTFMETHPGRPLAFHNASSFVNTWLRARQEPFLWGLARNDVASFAAEHGWKLDSLSSTEELRSTILARHGLTLAPLAIGESIAVLTKSVLP